MNGYKAYKLWHKYFNRKTLLSVFDEKIKNKTSVGLDWITSESFENNINKNIETIIKKCCSSTYKFTRYRELLISKGSSSPPRCISIPTIRDKLLLSIINMIINGVYGSSAISEMPQVIINSIKKELDTEKYTTYIKIDISSFYSSINHDIILKKIKRKIRKRELLYIIESAIKTETINPSSLSQKLYRKEGVPEGLSISNSLANIYLNNIDEKYSYNQDKYSYWRYVDDILILTSTNMAEKQKSNIINDLDKLGLKCNEEKSVVGGISSGFEYLGYCFTSGLISVRKKSVISFERAIDSIFRNYCSSDNKNAEYLQWKVNLKITGFVIDGHKYGWLFFYSQINDLKAIAHLDWLVMRFAKRYKINPNIRFKKFMRSYNEITRALHTTNYIPNLDLYTVDEKRRIVQNIYGENTKNRNDEVVAGRFRKLMNREIRDIQKDVQSFS